jgi:hypothetical protein
MLNDEREKLGAGDYYIYSVSISDKYRISLSVASPPILRLRLPWRKGGRVCVTARKLHQLCRRADNQDWSKVGSTCACTHDIQGNLRQTMESACTVYLLKKILCKQKIPRHIKLAIHV